jgi:hypothetical protein
MQVPSIRMLMAFAILLHSGFAYAQAKTDREIEIHKNIKLIELVPAADIPEHIVKQYQEFLPKFEEVLTSNTEDQSEDCLLTLRISAGVKTIGSAKTNRPTANVTAFRKGSKAEYLGVLLLYSYITSGPIDKEEILKFLKVQILDPAACGKGSE